MSLVSETEDIQSSIESGDEDDDETKDGEYERTSDDLFLNFLCFVCTWLVTISDIKGITDPLSKVEAGLKVDGADVPLQAVHIRAQLIDLSAKVTSRLPILMCMLVSLNTKVTCSLIYLSRIAVCSYFIVVGTDVEGTRREG